MVQVKKKSEDSLTD